MESDLRHSPVLVELAATREEPEWEGDWIDLGGEG
jgi:hypothetical protein